MAAACSAVAFNYVCVKRRGSAWLAEAQCQKRTCRASVSTRSPTASCLLLEATKVDKRKKAATEAGRNSSDGSTARCSTSVISTPLPFGRESRPDGQARSCQFLLRLQASQLESVPTSRPRAAILLVMSHGR